MSDTLPSLSPRPMSPAAVSQRAAVFELIRNGYSYREVSIRLKIPVDKISAMLRAEIAEARIATREMLEQVLPIELERLDMMQRQLMPFTVAREIEVIEDGVVVKQLVPPSIDHIETALKVMKHRSALLGLQAPSRSVQITVPWEKLTTEQMARVAQGEDIERVLADSADTTPEVKDVTPPNSPRNSQIVVPADHPLARIPVEETADGYIEDPPPPPPQLGTPFVYDADPSKWFHTTLDRKTMQVRILNGPGPKLRREIEAEQKRIRDRDARWAAEKAKKAARKAAKLAER